MKWNELGGKSPVLGYEKYGIQADTHYLEEAQERLSYRFPVIELGGRLAKEDRIGKLIPIIECGRMYFPTALMYNPIGEYRKKGEIDLVEALIQDELLTFPRGAHDDIIDALARVLEEDLEATFPKITTNRSNRRFVEEDIDWMDL